MWFDYVNSAGIIGALAVGAFQAHRLSADARERDKDRRIERALDLYRDLVVEGDTALAFHELSVLLRTEGSRRFSTNTWYLIDDRELLRGGLLDPTVTGMKTSFQNLYKVLWFFERVQKSLEYNLIDSEVMYGTIGYHCWWWDQLLVKVRAPKAAAALHQLGPEAARWAMRHQCYDDWIARCADDFDGDGPKAP
jgi:hypothetical protein